MKKLLLLALATLSMTGCSTDDATPVTTPPTSEEPQQEGPRLYKLFYDYGNVPMQNVKVEVKTGNGPWITQEWELRRIKFHYGDSIHFYAENFYLPDVVNRVNLHVHNRVPYYDDEKNYDLTISNNDAPLDRKIKMEFPEYDDYPTYDNE